MTENYLIGFALILLLGISGQWLAWKLKVPSIIVLMTLGLIVGPFFNILNPSLILGDLLFPLVSLLVSIIVFEGGLSLKFKDLKGMVKPLSQLIIIGTLLSFALISYANIKILNLPVSLGILFGSMMIITGPTVIVPMLKHVKLNRSFGSLMRWEGILIAPVGTLLILFVNEYFFGINQDLFSATKYLSTTLLIGSTFGIIGGLLLFFKIRKEWAPESLQEVITLMIVVCTYAFGTHVQNGAGLVAVIIMGIFITNQNSAKIQHIEEFKENLRVLSISSLFIILSATISMNEIQKYLTLNTGLYLLFIIFIARPIPVLISCIGTKLSFKEQLFLSWMAPRGIVTASIASLFSLELVKRGVDGAESLVPLGFLVIITTVIIYGLTAEKIQSLLKLSSPNQNGILIIGAGIFARSLSKILIDLNIYVELIDSNRERVLKAQKEGLKIYHSNIFSNRILEELELSGIGKILSLSSSDEVNLLSSFQYNEIIGKDNIFRLIPGSKSIYHDKLLQKMNQDNQLFSKGVNYSYLSSLLQSGQKIEYKKIKTDKKTKDSSILKLFLLRDKKLLPYKQEKEPTAKDGDTLIYITKS